MPPYQTPGLGPELEPMALESLLSPFCTATDVFLKTHKTVHKHSHSDRGCYETHLLSRLCYLIYGKECNTDLMLSVFSCNRFY